ncbi:extracellular solute-binding protein [Paenibacillus sp. F411]|uniref:Putative multiple sugar transport system substrate-binding protein YtcQ n=1 Tax=Paenibacillus algicola TaxID=2565926 RepID=A0A4P8XS85_9BACL|nr:MULTISPECIES: extracellular solute-binding protein [Paenibacillus]MBO2944614.1 extracellular solute-binding protein [Paenibacillus sp. F411]QCT04751.1 putative multiple sugar transport system substrate-binding protein YtcQ [Paenibacillus algicola]
MKKKTKAFTLLSTAVLVGVVGCSNGGSSATPAKTPDSSSSEPFELSLQFHHESQVPENDSRILKMIEEYTNTNINVIGVPSSSNTEKFSVTVASGNFPSAIKAFYEVPVVNAIKSGVFWEIGPYLKDYPNLSAIKPQVYDNLKVQGKIYGIPSVRDLARNTITYRKDWLEKLGLPEPATVDEFYNMLKAFTTQDPDGNGKDDTYGLIESNSLANFDMIAGFFGAPNQWGVEDGKLIPSFQTEAYLEALQFYRKLFDEKIINQDFPITSYENWFKLWDTAKAGAMKQVTTVALHRERGAQKIDPDAKVGMVSLIEGPRGTQIFSESGSNGFFLISKSAVKTEEELKKVLDFFDKLMDEEMSNIFTWGIEGETYAIKDGKAEHTDKEGFSRLMSPYTQLSVGMLTENATPGVLHPLEQLALDMNKENEAVAVANPALTLDSETNTEKGAQLKKIIEDARVRFILGEIDEAAWQAAIDQWKKDGGQQIMDEFTAAYNASNK